MKFFSRLLLACVLQAAFFIQSSAQSGNTEPWSAKQLLEPAELAKTINAGKALPYIYSIGPSAVIKGSVDIGPGKDNASIEKLKAAVSKLPKDAPIVLYCGCCPFRNCPNIRPAFTLLNQLKFTNHKLLNLATNVRVDWISKGYPVTQ